MTNEGYYTSRDCSRNELPLPLPEAVIDARQGAEIWKTTRYLVKTQFMKKSRNPAAAEVNYYPSTLTQKVSGSRVDFALHTSH